MTCEKIQSHTLHGGNLEVALIDALYSVRSERQLCGAKSLVIRFKVYKLKSTYAGGV